MAASSGRAARICTPVSLTASAAAAVGPGAPHGPAAGQLHPEAELAGLDALGGDGYSHLALRALHAQHADALLALGGAHGSCLGAARQLQRVRLARAGGACVGEGAGRPRVVVHAEGVEAARTVGEPDL